MASVILEYLTSNTTSAERKPCNSIDGSVGLMSAINMLWNLNLFETAAAKVIAGEVGGTVADIKEGSVFLQKKNTLVDKLYDVIMDKNNRLKLNPKTATDRRHYTFDGKPVAKSVTEKIKEEISRNMPERTGLDAVS